MIFIFEEIAEHIPGSHCSIIFPGPFKQSWFGRTPFFLVNFSGIMQFWFILNMHLSFVNSRSGFGMGDI